MYFMSCIQHEASQYRMFFFFDTSSKGSSQVVKRTFSVLEMTVEVSACDASQRVSLGFRITTGQKERKATIP